MKKLLWRKIVHYFYQKSAIIQFFHVGQIPPKLHASFPSKWVIFTRLLKNQRKKKEYANPTTFLRELKNSLKWLRKPFLILLDFLYRSQWPFWGRDCYKLLTGSSRSASTISLFEIFGAFSSLSNFSAISRCCIFGTFNLLSTQNCIVLELPVYNTSDRHFHIWLFIWHRHSYLLTSLDA